MSLPYSKETYLFESLFVLLSFALLATTNVIKPNEITSAPEQLDANNLTAVNSGNDTLNETLEAVAIDFRIMYGDRANADEYKFAVRLVIIKSRSEPLEYCGASLINEEWLLTAAHCVDNPRVTTIWALIGSVNGSIQVLNKNPDFRQDIQAERWFTHPSYNRTKMINDVGLIQLSKKVNMSGPGKIEFVKLPSPAACSANYAFSSRMVDGCFSMVVMGWGKTEQRNLKQQQMFSEMLMKVDLKVLPHATCQSSLAATFHPGQICAGGLNNSAADTCGGDSGGPLVCQHHRDIVQIALVSFGSEQCGKEKPSINTRICHYLDWINEISIGCSKFQVPEIENGVLNGTDYYFKSNRTIICNDGFMLDGDAEVTCLADSWSTPQGRCIDPATVTTRRVTCPTFAGRKFNNAVIVASTDRSFAAGTTRALRCTNGAKMADGGTTAVLTCLADGNWSAIPECN